MHYRRKMKEIEREMRVDLKETMSFVLSQQTVHHSQLPVYSPSFNDISEFRITNQLSLPFAQVNVYFLFFVFIVD